MMPARQLAAKGAFSVGKGSAVAFPFVSKAIYSGRNLLWQFLKQQRLFAILAKTWLKVCLA